MNAPGEEYDDDYDDDYDGPFGGGIGCAHCQQAGWHHGCCDDLCHGCNEPEDCDDAYPCRHCNPHGEVTF